ncbi:cupin domain-containing protein [Amycolatopsis sp. FDAARGOS 1241]|uniref:cupin domain-containing protein n=1 Tax=Amycolatopsis sp. FDAARGOS 1241 TaxID=2778070 RepID=UPI0019526F03|nr:cupin domain-containing protein [Amycolatopsis sp. FDAARGOS 1241]QRP42782.1 cupin domain-containing protein [Amycolatopsis sp. FDAARGOS 1241]
MSPITPTRPYVLGPTDGQSWWFLGSLATVKCGGADTRGRLTVAEFVNPAGFAPPLHRHHVEDEMFYVLSGTARFRCDGEDLAAGPGDFVMLPVGLAHTFVVGPDEPLRALQITTPGGFEHFLAEAGEPARAHRLPGVGELDATRLDPAAIGHASARHHVEILGPPPNPAG